MSGWNNWRKCAVTSRRAKSAAYVFDARHSPGMDGRGFGEPHPRVAPLRESRQAGRRKATKAKEIFRLFCYNLRGLISRHFPPKSDVFSAFSRFNFISSTRFGRREKFRKLIEARGTPLGAQRFGKSIILLVVLILFAAMWFNTSLHNGKQTKEMKYSEFYNNLVSGKIGQCFDC